MWQKIGTYVIRNRFWFLVALGIVTLFFGYFATKVQLTYDFAKVIPDNDPDFVEYVKFKQTFGEDGNILAIGIQSNKLYEKDFFNDLIELNNKISETNGVEKALSITNLYMPYRNDSLHKLELKPIVNSYLQSQAEMDSVKKVISSLPLYKGLLYNEKGDVALLAITLNKKN